LRNKNIEQFFEMEQEKEMNNKFLESLRELEDSYKLEEVRTRLSS
jgi:hypothetical protein